MREYSMIHIDIFFKKTYKLLPSAWQNQNDEPLLMSIEKTEKHGPSNKKGISFRKVIYTVWEKKTSYFRCNK